ncbi:MAG TPA: hypothetical protein VNO33_06280 [Kofleriaceae bacterium]|nr:hypothetical protein [Kofleriaceae bacterium]
MRRLPSVLRDLPSRPAALVAAAAAMAAFALFWARGIAYLDVRHPHEDAYILFRYVDNLVAGEGIAFNPGGPPTEGATDFLWMILLSVPVRLGVDVARAAVLLNAAGCALLAWVVARVWLLPARPGAVAHVAALVFAVCLPWLPGAQAAYDGFSLQLYAGLIALLFWVWLHPSPRAMTALPYLALAVGLFRPDGVLIGVGFAVTAVIAARRDRAALRALLIHAGTAVLLGALYFAWRWWYFGELLPLPLYVKSQGGSLGWATNVRWMKEAVGPRPLLLTAGLLGAVLLAARHRDPLRAALALVPAGFLFAALASAQQAQNIEWRFQAPIHVLAMLVAMRLGAALLELADRGWRPAPGAAGLSGRRAHVARALLALGAAAACLVALRPALVAGKTLFPRDYMDTFAVRAGPALDDATIVLTEAGRLPFWTAGAAFDMVGLNHAPTSRRPPTLESVAGLDPDVVLFHAAGTLDNTRLLAHEPERGAVARVDPRNQRVLQIDPRTLTRAIRPAFRAISKSLPAAYSEKTPRVKTASIILAVYLAAHADDFHVYALPYGPAHEHILAVRVGRPEVADFEPLIAGALALRYRSYADARGWQRGAACALSARIASLWRRRSGACGW